MTSTRLLVGALSFFLNATAAAGDVGIYRTDYPTFLGTFPSATAEGLCRAFADAHNEYWGSSDHFTYVSNTEQQCFFQSPSRNYLTSADFLIVRPPLREKQKTLGEPKDSCVGNPCDPSSGNKFARETDYAGKGSFPLSFSRFYNSAAVASNPLLLAPLGSTLGGLWTHTFDRFIVSNGVDAAAAFRQDGKAFIFALVGDNWVPDGDVADKLEWLGNGWRFTNSSGDEVETYDIYGKLVSISNRAGLTQTLSYFTSPPNQGKLQQVSDPFGRTLSFGYNANNFLISMTDPAGGIYEFKYDGQLRLNQVIYPGTAPRPTRTYVYNSVWKQALEGIIDENSDRFATWGYDTTNHVVTSSEHAGGAEKVTLSYNANATQVTSFVNPGLSAVRTYTFQTILGVNRNAQITGDPCPECGPATRSFDVNGNVSSRTD